MGGLDLTVPTSLSHCGREGCGGRGEGRDQQSGFIFNRLVGFHLNECVSLSPKNNQNITAACEEARTGVGLGGGGSKVAQR